MCYCTVGIFKMYTYTNEEYVDIHFSYGFCDGNAKAAVKKNTRDES